MNERGNNANKIYIELATEFLHSLMESANNIISISCKTFINEFFDQSVFNLFILFLISVFLINNLDRISSICPKNVCDCGKSSLDCFLRTILT